MRFNLKASDMLLYIPKLNRNITVSRRVVEFHFFFFFLDKALCPTCSRRGSREDGALNTRIIAFFDYE